MTSDGQQQIPVRPVLRASEGSTELHFPALPHPQVFREFTSVDEGVFLHIRLLMEPLATVLTGVGPGV